MKKPLYRTVIIAGYVSSSERKQFEDIENKKFETKEDILKELGGDSEDFLVLELTDFMDACNNQTFFSLDDSWIGYVQLEN